MFDDVEHEEIPPTKRPDCNGKKSGVLKRRVHRDQRAARKNAENQKQPALEEDRARTGQVIRQSHSCRDVASAGVFNGSETSLLTVLSKSSHRSSRNKTDVKCFNDRDP
jgi:hypothetical protein